jgi:two-component system phosphate regulon sensor histidine kinase PhoR
MTPRPQIFRFIIPFVIMIVVVVGVCGAVVYWAGQRNVRLQQIHDLDRLVRLVRSVGIVSGDFSNITPEQTTRINDWATLLDTRITLIAGKGVVVLDTLADPSRMVNHNNRPEVIAARATGVGSSVRRSDTISENAVYVAQLLDHADKNGPIVRLSYPEHVWTKLGVPISAIVLAATVSAALVMVLLALVLQRQWIGPVKALASAAEEMASGQWQTRVELAGAEAVRFLGARFNIMASHAQRQVADLNHQRADLQSLVDSLPDPILLTDSMERIAVINAPAARLLQLTPVQAVGKKVNVVVNEEAILRVADDVKGATAPITRELRLIRAGQHVTYHAVAAGTKAGGVLLVLRNVSAMAAAVQMKTDFVANASHELRTPIAAIKAAFETLQEVYTDDPDQTARCVTIIDGHLKRLEEMLSDLLDLSRVESVDIKAQLLPVKMPDLISFVRSTMGIIARQKEVELRFDANDWGDEFEFNSDRHLLELVLKNLVENSIKFTPSGGTVTVRLARTSGTIVMEVIDTGIGIPPEHQERVFERFYQVDAARSGSAGRGTGLGLAIVKHAIHALGGSVQLASEVGRGTTVMCLLPIVPAQEEQVVITQSVEAGG